MVTDEAISLDMLGRTYARRASPHQGAHFGLPSLVYGNDESFDLGQLGFLKIPHFVGLVTNTLILLFALRAVAHEHDSFWRIIGIISAAGSGIGVISNLGSLLK